MPRRLDEQHRPKLAPTAADLGEEAYRANRNDPLGHEEAHESRPVGTVPPWKSPKPRHEPPGQEQMHGPELRLGREPRHDDR